MINVSDPSGQYLKTYSPFAAISALKTTLPSISRASNTAKGAMVSFCIPASGSEQIGKRKGKKCFFSSSEKCSWMLIADNAINRDEVKTIFKRKGVDVDAN